MTEAAVFSALVDTLIPGDDIFPPASQTGTQHWLLNKLLGEQDAALLEQVLLAVGEDFDTHDPQQQAAILRSFEAAQPDQFALVRQLTYFGYYQSPLVVRAIRKLGFIYNDAPQPNGYDLGVFNPAIHLPAQPKGYYIPTDQVQPVDLNDIPLSPEERYYVNQA